MCGRSSVSKKEADLEKRFNARFYSADLDRYNPLPIYNVCPTTFVPVITNIDSKHIKYLHWGFDLESWDGILHKNTINARIENIQKISLFNECLSMRRCIIPATSYFEWKTLNKGKTKIPYLIKLKSLEIFSIAGLWVNQMNSNGEMTEKFVLITQPPTPKLSYIHDRMPALLTPENELKWLNTELNTKEAIQLINKFNDNEIIYHPVSNELNRSFENKAEFIREKKYEIEEQGNLF
ncbi:MAG: SOS response-associated peptidase [Bacteroidota bacterium]|nr:SOS response-associated peptidase [Bacteroidota bacterium]